MKHARHRQFSHRGQQGGAGTRERGEATRLGWTRRKEVLAFAKEHGIDETGPTPFCAGSELRSGSINEAC